MRVGAGVDTLAAGMRVGIPWLGKTCGHCRYCREGRENLCDHPLFTGYTRDGGYATHVVADARYVFRLPDSGDDVADAPLLCAGLIGWRSLQMAGDGKKIGFYGFGAAAHIIAQVARWQGRDVYAFTRSGDGAAQAFARKLGACWAGSSDDAPPDELDCAIIYAPVGALVPAALRARAQGRTRRLRRHSYERYSELSLQYSVGGAGAQVGRQSHPQRRRGVLRHRAAGRHRDADRALSARIAPTTRCRIYGPGGCRAPRCWCRNLFYALRARMASVCSGEPDASTIVQVTAPISNSSCMRATLASASDASGPRDPTRSRRVGRSATRNSPRKSAFAARGGRFDRGALLRSGEDRVDDDRMTGARDARGLVGQAAIDRFGHFGPIGLGRQTIVLGHAEKRFALDIRAQHQRAGRRRDVSGASARAKSDLPVPDNPPVQTIVGFAGTKQFEREIEIASSPTARDRLCPRRAARSRRAAVTLARIAARSDMKNGNAAMPSQSSSRREAAKYPFNTAFAGARQPAFDQIHQQKRQIVKHVACGDDGIEFQRVEGDRLAVENRDIAEMKVAMAAPDQARGAARIKERAQFRQGGLRFSLKLVDRARREQFAVLAERRGVVRDEFRRRRRATARLRPARRAHAWRRRRPRAWR